MDSRKKKSASIPSIISPATADDSFITPRQVAERLHIKVSTIHEWSRRRQSNPLPHYSISKKVVYFKWTEVCAWIEAQRVAA